MIRCSLYIYDNDHSEIINNTINNKVLSSISLYEGWYLTNSKATSFHPPPGPGFKVLVNHVKICHIAAYLEVDQG